MTLCVNVRIIFFEQISDHNKHSSGRSERINDNNEQINGLDEQINEQITERQRAVLEFTRVTPDATYDVMARAVGVSSATVRRDVESLVRYGLLKRVGSRKTGRWEVLRSPSG